MKRYEFRRGMTTVLMVCLSLIFALADSGVAQRRGQPRRFAAVCGDPTVRCNTSVEFQPYQLPFRLPPRAVIWESELFYAIILRSIREPEENCTRFIPESERIEAQSLFPRHKVFTSRCFEPGDLYYTNVARNTQFMGVYAGRTQAEAAQMLERVRATGRFPGASIRRMRAGFNGT